MPNRSNADAPITLLGIGRSGTSLLEASFRAHPNIQSIGESADIIFCTASGAQFSAIPSRHKFSDAHDYAGFVVRETLAAIEPSAQPRWFHKPAGVPKVMPWARLPGEKSTGGFPLEWYWRVLEAAFPNGHYIISLRNPWDVVMSWERFAGWEQKALWRDVLITYRILEHRRDRFDSILFFDDLIQQPAATLERVFAAVGLPMIDSALGAFDKPRSMKGNQIMATHRESWDRCQAPNLSPEEAAFIAGIWHSLGRSFESPSQFDGVFRF